MALTLLLDLDDTLLESNMRAFLPAYYEALGRHLEPLVPPREMLATLQAGVQLMLESADPSRTLRGVFEDEFYPRIAVGPEQLRQSVDGFYDTVFPTLGKLARPRPGAVELVDWALSAGHQVVIATDPLFPLQATEERVRWAGLDPRRLDLITSFESFHFSKSHPAYFAEVLGRLGWPDRPALMVGNDVERDLTPARKLGLMTYHVDGSRPADAIQAGPSRADPLIERAGDLKQLRQWLQSANLDSYLPTFKTTESLLAVLEATPAVLQSMTTDLDEAKWKLEPTAEDWAMIELVCHLRDTEREVHALQLSTLLEAATPFVPRPDAAIWAKQRRYLSENGPASVADFAAARVTTLQRLRTVPDEVWSKPAKHAIFGPTNFREVIGFMAEHDRMHLQQAWRTLQVLGTGPHRK